MESISIFDILKVGIGPSSSHTIGPWKAVQQCLAEYAEKHEISMIRSVQIQLFGSLAKTGPGHGTKKAIMLGLMGFDPATIDCSKIDAYIDGIKTTGKIVVGEKEIVFDPVQHIIYKTEEQLPFHSNALKVSVFHENNEVYEDIFYSIGGGFVVKGPTEDDGKSSGLPFPVAYGDDLLKWCDKEGCSVYEIVRRNERAWRSEKEIADQLRQIIDAMQASVYNGCHSTGVLPGGLNVRRRASYQNENLIPNHSYHSVKE